MLSIEVVSSELLDCGLCLLLVPTNDEGLPSHLDVLLSVNLKDIDPYIAE